MKLTRTYHLRIYANNTKADHIDHADVNAARNIAEKGKTSLAKVFGEASRC